MISGQRATSDVAPRFLAGTSYPAGSGIGYVHRLASAVYQSTGCMIAFFVLPRIAILRQACGFSRQSRWWFFYAKTSASSLFCGAGRKRMRQSLGLKCCRHVLLSRDMRWVMETTRQARPWPTSSRRFLAHIRSVPKQFSLTRR